MNKKTPNEELNRLSPEEFKSAEKTPLIVVLDNVRSAQNVGSVFRTSDAFKIEAIYLCGITATPPSREINKTALGATESVKWHYAQSSEECISSLRNDGWICLAVEQTSLSEKLGVYRIAPDKKYAVVLGNEVHGVEQNVIDLCDGSLEITQYGTKHSLNISVCTGIVLWEFFQVLKR